MFHTLRVLATTLSVGAALLFGSATVRAQGVGRGGFVGGNFGAYYRPGTYYDGGYHPAYSYSPYLSQYGQNRLLRFDEARPSYAGSGFQPNSLADYGVAADPRNRTPGYQPDLGIYVNSRPVYPAASRTPSAESALPPVDVAELNIVLPAAGTVSFGRFQSDQESGSHLYQSPSLSPGDTYSYKIQAKWSENGREMNRTKTVKFRAGERLQVDFRDPSNG
jgi:uncharacterized protein (TIGR03000 family)